MNQQHVLPEILDPSEQRVGRLSIDVTSKAERRLWATVLLSIVHDLCAPHRNFRDRQTAERWVGTYPSSDFREVVSLAGLDPQATWDRMNAMAVLPFEDRIWVRDNATQVKRGRDKTRIDEGLAA